MIINLKDLSTALGKITDLVNWNKHTPGVMFSIGDTVKVCYSDGLSAFIEEVEATVSDEDVKGDIIFNYTALTNIIDACKPSGRIITNVVEFQFNETNTAKVKAEKRIITSVIDEMSGESQDNETVASVIEQSISWVWAKDAGIKSSILIRENYESMMHYADEYIAEHFGESPIKPISDTQWETEKDDWELDELKNILSKLSIENGTVVCVSPKTKMAFVANTYCVICIPVHSEIKHKIVLSSAMSRAIASVLSKTDTEEGTIYVHTITNENTVYTNNSGTTFRIQNIKPDGSAVKTANGYLTEEFTDYLLTLNREVLQSCLAGAKTANASDKVGISFVHFEDEFGNRRTKLSIEAKNTTSSTKNTYDIIVDHLIDLEDSIEDLRLNVSLNLLYQAVSKAETDYIAFDVKMVGDMKHIRIGEIDLEARQSISEEYEKEAGWEPEFMIEHRREILGYTTYFIASKD